MDELIKKKYKDTVQEIDFEKEVDFHHQIAYRFEKSWKIKINNGLESIIEQADNDIKELLENQLWILEIDPMILFYCLHFSVYYQNHEMCEWTEQMIKS